MSKKIEPFFAGEFCSRNEIDNKVNLINKMSELIDTANEHSRELIRLHVRIMDLSYAFKSTPKKIEPMDMDDLYTHNYGDIDQIMSYIYQLGKKINELITINE